MAASIGLAAAALGTEVDGSIVFPGSSNNVAGIKPTVGLTSRALVIPYRGRYHTVGPLARTVKDAAYVLQAVAGKDPDDNETAAIPFDPLPDYVGACQPSSLKGKRIGVPRNLIPQQGRDGPLLQAFDRAVQTLRHAGATVLDDLAVSADAARDSLNGSTTSFTRMLSADLVELLPKDYLAQLVQNPQGVRTLADVRDFTVRTPAEDYPERDVGIFDVCLALDFNMSSPEYAALYNRNQQLAGPEGVLGLLANYSLDALVLPSAFSPDLPARVGAPIITVPSESSEGHA